MAVGYQYQNDYENKQNKKSSKKKLIILVSGIVFLVFIAIIGMPKSEPVVVNNQTQDAKLNELPVADSYNLDDKQKSIKLNTDGFLLSLINDEDYKDYMVPIVYSAVKDKESLLDKLRSLNLETCILQNIEIKESNKISIVQYSCDGFVVLISTSEVDGDNILNKVISWKVEDSE
jgi:hypothetical protein